MADNDDTGSQNATFWRIGAGIVLVIAAGAGIWWYLHRSPERKPPAAAATEESAPEPAVAEQSPPPVGHPLEPAADTPAAPLPALAESDPALADSLQGLIGAAAVQAWLQPEQIARRFVATIDNLPRDVPLEKLRPLRAPTDSFGVDRTTGADGDERITLGARNALRYDAAVAVLEKLDMQQVAASYRHFYPLLQQAYEDLGYPDRYFNDRLVAAIDDMLRAPEINGPVVLTQPKVLYQYEDPALERLSSGQKLMIRMGPAHARTVKARLRELRTLITAPAAKTPAAK